MAKPLEQCLEDETYPEIQRLASCRNLRLSLVADQKGDKSLRAYKFNKEKTLNWLDEKTKKLVEIVKAKNINVSQATVSANYINSKYQSKSETGRCKEHYFCSYKKSYKKRNDKKFNIIIKKFAIHSFKSDIT